MAITEEQAAGFVAFVERANEMIAANHARRRAQMGWKQPTPSSAWHFYDGHHSVCWVWERADIDEALIWKLPERTCARCMKRYLWRRDHNRLFEPAEVE